MAASQFAAKKLRKIPPVRPVWVFAFFGFLIAVATVCVCVQLNKPIPSVPAVQPMASANPSYMGIIKASLKNRVTLTKRSYQINGDNRSQLVCAEITSPDIAGGEPVWAVWHVKDPATYMIQSAEPIAEKASFLPTDDAPSEAALKLQKAAARQSARL